MSQASVLYRFRLDVSDIDRAVYDRLDFRMAMHASESFPFLLTRMLAYALNVEPGLNFSAEGLGDPDDPCISSDDPKGGIDLWIEVGSPSAKRLHKAAKAARRVRVYTYKSAELLLKEMEKGDTYHAKKIEVFSLDPEFLERLEQMLVRDNSWGLVHDQGSLLLNAGDISVQGEVRSHPTNFR